MTLTPTPYTKATNPTSAATELRKRRVRNQAALHELPYHREHALVDDDLGRQEHQESHTIVVGGG